MTVLPPLVARTGERLAVTLEARADELSERLLPIESVLTAEDLDGKNVKVMAAGRCGGKANLSP